MRTPETPQRHWPSRLRWPSRLERRGRRPRLLAAVALLAAATQLPSSAGPLESLRPAVAATQPADENRPGGHPRAAAAAQRQKRPNIVLITTDDQRTSDLATMPRVKQLIGNQGTSFAGLSPNPLCCPARAMMLTGQYSQNNGVRSNRGAFGGYHALRRYRTVATALSDAGYATAFAGKYLNGYENGGNNRGVDPGWSSWHALARRVYNYTNFTVNADGALANKADTFQTDYLSRHAVRSVNALADGGRPFFVWQSYVSPHRGRDRTPGWVPPASAPRHRSLFRNTPLVSAGDPAFDEADVSDKPQWVRSQARLDRGATRDLRELHRSRLRSLQAVDEGVARLFAALRRSGELADTLVIFTSDNGMLLGEHRLRGKDAPYEQSLAVPMLMRGPGVPVQGRVRRVGTTLDVGATILAAAGAEPRWKVDGLDLRLVATGDAPKRDTLLIQAGPRTRREDRLGWSWRGVRTARYTFVRYLRTNERELYDRRADPAQLVNLAGKPRYASVQAELRHRLKSLQDCEGSACARRFGPIGGPSGG